MYILKGLVIDGNGGEPLEKGLVAVEGNKITAVCNEWEYPIPENARVIEVKDGAVMPGFIEQHCHMGLGDDYYRIYREHAYHAVCRVISEMKILLDGGFTTLRECGGMTNYLKGAWEEGLIEGPRICSSGKVIIQSGGHLDYIKDFPIEFTKHHDRNFASEIADGVTEVRRAARMHFREKCDFIKIMGTAGVACQGNKLFTREYSDEELRAFVEEAENYGSYVAIHAHGIDGIRAAIRAGVRSIEHASYIDEQACEDLMKIDGWIVPTLATGHVTLQNLDKRAPWVGPKTRAACAKKSETLRLAHKMGVTIGLGADYGGGIVTDYHIDGLEFPLLVNEGGLTPMEAIVAATRTGSRIVMREDELGTLEPGKLADIVVCGGNPLQDISLLADQKNIKVVMQDGKLKKQID